VAARMRPRGRRVRRLDRVTDVLAVPFGDFREQRPRWRQDLAAVALIRAHLGAADEELVGAVNGGKGERGMGNGGPCCALRSRVSSRPFPFPLSRFPFWLEILPHPLFPALTSEP